MGGPNVELGQIHLVRALDDLSSVLPPRDGSAPPLTKAAPLILTLISRSIPRADPARHDPTRRFSGARGRDDDAFTRSVRADETHRPAACHPVSVSISAEDVHRALRELGSLRFGQLDVQGAMQQIATTTHALFSVDGAGLLLLGADDRLRTAASSDDRVARLEQLQVEHDEGPCLDAYTGRELVCSEDLSAEDRWPDFSPAAVRDGLLSVLASPIPYNQDAIGVVAVVSAQARAWTPEGELALVAFTDLAALPDREHPPGPADLGSSCAPPARPRREDGHRAGQGGAHAARCADLPGGVRTATRPRTPRTSAHRGRRARPDRRGGTRLTSPAGRLRRAGLGSWGR